MADGEQWPGLDRLPPELIYEHCLAGRVGHGPQHLWKQAPAALLVSAVPVGDVAGQLAPQRPAALGGAVDLHEPVVFVADRVPR